MAIWLLHLSSALLVAKILVSLHLFNNMGFFMIFRASDRILARTRAEMSRLLKRLKLGSNKDKH